MNEILSWIISTLSHYSSLLISKSTYSPPNFNSISVILLISVLGALPFYGLMRYIILRNENEHSSIKIALFSVLIIIIIGFVANYISGSSYFNQKEGGIQKQDTNSTPSIGLSIPTMNLSGGNYG